MLSPADVFAPKVSDTQSDATNNNRKQDIIEIHNLKTHGIPEKIL